MNIGEVIYSGQLWVALPIAVVAGLVSFLSPCVLPLVPGYLAYVSGSSHVGMGESAKSATWRVVAGVALFVAGFSLVFISYGAAFGALGGWLVQWQVLITRILGVVVIIMGFVFIGRFGMFQRTSKLNLSPATGLAGAPILGIVFGLGWTPCIGPALIAIMSLSVDAASPWRGTILGLAYCIGLGLPFILLAFGLSWATSSVTFLKLHIRAINIAGGVALIVLGALMVTGLWNIWIYQLQAVISSYVPAI